MEGKTMEGKTMEEKITNLDLKKNKYYYKESIIEKNIENLNPKIILNTQKLSADFCVKYILNLNIDGGDEDNYLFDSTYILNKQTHISENEWNNAMRNIIK